MAGNERRRQKKLMKKRGDRARKRKAGQQAAAFPSDQRRKVMAARKLPLHECLINGGWKERGIASILVARRQPDGKIVFGAYLVDVFCLGVKSAFGHADVSESRYEGEINSKLGAGDPLAPCPPALAHHIIYAGLDYAKRFGFKPDPDFKWAQGVLDERGVHPPCPEVEFGKDGKPFFIAGPHDNAERIIRRLEAAVGPDNFTFIAGVGPGEEFLEDPDDESD